MVSDNFKVYLGEIMNKLLLVIMAATILLGGCARNISPNTYQAAEAGVVSKVVSGVIIGKREVNIDANSGAGGMAGVAAGATGGSAIGGGARSNIVGAIGGAVIGGVIGNAADKAVNRHKGFEYIIRLDNGSIISIAQTNDIQFEVKQRVLVVYGAMTRIVPDTTESNDKIR